MKVLLDTNVILDYILVRDRYFENAKILFYNIFERKFEAYVSGSAITDIFYLVKKE